MLGVIRQASRLSVGAVHASRQLHSLARFTAPNYARRLAVGAFLAITLGVYSSGIARAKDEDKTEEIETSDESGKHNEKGEEEEEEEEAVEKDKIRVKAYKYVIVGAGTAAHAAMQAILENDKDAQILVIGYERYKPYMRPALSKELWRSKDPDVEEHLRFKDWEGRDTSLFYQTETEKDPRVTYITDKQVIDLHPVRKLVLLDDFEVVSYDKCLIATGGNPKTLKAAKGMENVTSFRDIDDFKKAHSLLNDKKHITIVGGGFLGSELAWSISEKGKSSGIQVTQIFPESGVLSTVLPRYLSDHATEMARTAGIEVLNERMVDGVSQTEGKVSLQLNNGKSIETDHVIVAAGITPSTSFIKSFPVELDPKNGGIVTNDEFQVVTDLWAAGDVASFWDPTLGERRRVEHHEHAIRSGALAGQNMSNTDPTNRGLFYHYQPMFWSDLGPMGFEAVGNIDSRLKTVSVWQNETEANDKSNLRGKYKKGVVYYLKNDLVVGVLLCGVHGQMEDARTLIYQRRTIRDPAELQHMLALEPSHKEDADHE